MRRFLPLLVFTLLAAPSAVAAQGFAIAGHVGTVGLGGSAILGLSPQVNLRGTVGYSPNDFSLEIADIDWFFSAPTFWRGLLDFYPTGGSFHLSAGGIWVGNDGAFDAVGTISDDHQFDDGIYSPDEVVELVGTFNLTGFQPYVGIGFGNPVSRTLGLNVDLGVGFGDVPTVELMATGPIGSDPEFQEDLDAEIVNIEDDIPEILKYYPVLSISLSIGFGN